MKERDSARIQAVHQIAAVLAGAYIRLRLPAPFNLGVDCAETKSDSSRVGENT